jgi:hypothetical protein
MGAMSSPSSLAEAAGGGHRPGRAPGAGCPFTILDAMILVAGTAVSAAASRSFLERSGWFEGSFLTVEGPWVLIASQVLFGWSLALLACQATRRGQQVRRVGRWPGTAACLAVLVAGLFNLQYYWMLGLMRTLPPRRFLIVSLTRPLAIAPAVAAAWLVLGLSGRWRPTRDWPDRCGRLVGWAWLSLYLLALVQIAR